jgi:hypothetical protein
MIKLTNMLTVPCVVFLVFSLMTVLGGCGGIMEEEDAPSELIGSWYGNDYKFAFEIDRTGEGYIAASKTHCTVSVSVKTVYFRDYHDNVVGTFRYTLNNDELTITAKTGDFNDMSSASPFIKSGTIPFPYYGNVPVELIGTWYAKNNAPLSPRFRITECTMTIFGSPESQYTTIVQGYTVSVWSGGTQQGTFQYVFIYGEMVVTNGTDICKGWESLSPLVKK